MADNTPTVAVPTQTQASGSSQAATPPLSVPADLWRSILLLQLTECWNDVRNIDSLVWQIPAGIGAILGLVLSGLGIQAVKGRPSLLDVAVMFTVVLVSYALIFALYKNRRFQISRNVYIKCIYRHLLATHSTKDGELVSIGRLYIDDSEMDQLPGFVARATRDLISQAWCGIAYRPSRLFQINKKLEKFLVTMDEKASGRSAYRTMFRVSVFVLIGEFSLAIWLLIRYLS